MKTSFATLLALAALSASAAHAADLELSLYSGFQAAPHSDVTGDDPEAGGDKDFTAEWEGKSFSPPPYWGARAMWWKPNGFGFGVEVTHDKVYASDDTRAAQGYDRLEFTDGHNIITANVMKRWPGMFDRITPYVGAGVGVAMPHVDIQAVGGEQTYGYQITGPAVRWTVGASYDISSYWAVFGEYQGTYSQNTVDLENGGALKTDIVTNALNIGLTYKF